MIISKNMELRVERTEFSEGSEITVGKRTAPWKRANRENEGETVIARYSLHWPEELLSLDAQENDPETSEVVAGISRAVTMVEEILGEKVREEGAVVRYIVFQAEGEVKWATSAFECPWIVQANIGLDATKKEQSSFGGDYPMQGLQIPEEISKNTLVQIKVFHV